MLHANLMDMQSAVEALEVRTSTIKLILIYIQYRAKCVY